MRRAAGVVAPARFLGAAQPQLDLQPEGYILTTVHRAEDTDKPTRPCATVEGLRPVASEVPVAVPLHRRAREGLLNHAGRSLLLTAPVRYLDMVMPERHARLTAADCGGVPTDAFFPCVTLREATPWVELVARGWNRRAARPSAARVGRVVLEGELP